MEVHLAVAPDAIFIVVLGLAERCARTVSSGRTSIHAPVNSS